MAIKHSAQRGPEVRSQTATYEGTNDPTRRVNLYHSIPYCQIPEPFQQALPLAPGPRREVDARRARPDAIALSIAAPQGARFGDDLPVVVFIHGGSYIEGSHEDFDMGVLAAEGLVGVSIGYRLGAQGFAHFHDDPPEHYRGIEDCLLALEWVQREIEYFGGDPTNVTLAGQSAGAAICLWLTRTDHYRGLYRRVWALSPAFPRTPFNVRKAALRRAQGTAVTRRHFTTRLARHPQAFARGMRRYYRRYFSDVPLGPAPFDAAALADVPILVSVTRDELYTMRPLAWLDRHHLGRPAVRLLRRHLGINAPAGSVLQAADRIDPDHPLCRLTGDAVIRRWAVETAENARGQVWLFELTGTPEQPAVHCDDLPLILGPGTGAAGAPEAHGDHLLKFLVTLAHGEEPGWPEYRRSTRRAAAQIDRDTGAITRVTDPLKYVRLAFQQPRWR